MPTPGPAPAGLAVAELATRFMSHAEEHYRRADGTPTSEVANFRYALRPLVHLYGNLEVDQFGPLKLKAVRQLMVKGYRHPKFGPQETLARSEINARCGRIIRLFKWGVSEELVKPNTWQALRTVKGLERGRTTARETEPVKPVPVDVVEKTLPHLTAHVRAAVRLQMWTGCRADEALPLRGSDLDTKGAVWIYTTRHHKGSHRGKVRRIPIGPKGQEALTPLLKHRCPSCGIMDRAGRIAWCATAPLCGPCRDRADEASICGPWPLAPLTEEEGDYYLFSPRDMMMDRESERRAKRKTRVQPSQLSRKKKGARKYRDRYSVRCYLQMIERAAQKAGVEHWSSHQLRHLAGTMVREKHGLEAAQHLLGHEKADITQLYAEKNFDLAVRLAAELG